MSFILEALKKSDAKRRAQMGPDLSSPVGLLNASSIRPRQSVALWGLAGLIAVLAVGAVAFWVGSKPSDNAKSNPVVATGLPGANPETNMPIPEPSTDTAESISASEPVVPAEALVSSASSETYVIPQVTAATTSPESAVQARSAVPTPDPSSVKALEARLAASAQAVANGGADYISEQATAATEDVSAAAPDQSFEPWRPEVADYLYRWELPLSVRQSLPALNLLVHVYSKTPEDRFVLINGARFREGDELSPGVRLAEIRPQGALVDFRDYRFLLTQ